MKKFGVLLAGGVCATMAFGAPTLTDGVLTYDVAASETESATFASHGAVTKVVKKGAGTLVVSADNSAFAGTVEITEGIFSMSNGNAAGGASTTVYVRSGGQLMTTYASAQGDRTIYCPVHIDGDGPDHTGAIFCKYTNMGDNMFQGSVYLDGPATVGGSSRFGFYVVMNGQTLTNAVPCEHIFRGVNATNPGHIVYAAKGIMVLSGALNGSAANTMTLATTGAKLGWWSSGVTPAWTLKVEEDGSIAGGAGNSESVNNWGGPVVIAKGKVLTLGTYNNKANSSGSKGVISGEGAVCVDGGNDGYVGYLFAANTYTGETKVVKGTLVAKANKSIPEASPITVNGGHLRYVLDSGCWELAEVYKRLAKTSQPNGSVRLWTSSGQSVTDVTGFTTPSPAFGIGHDGPGSLTTTGKIVGGVLNNWAGTWTIAPTVAGSSATRVRLLDSASGKMVFKDAGCWTFLKNNNSEIGSANTPRLVIDNTVFAGAETKSGSDIGPYMWVGGGAGCRGVVEITGATASMTNKLYLGSSTNAVGAAYQNGGKVRMSCNSTADGAWGAGGYGFYDAAAGSLSIGHCLNLGNGSKTGTGILRASGGDVNVGGDMFVSSGGTGVVHVTAGTLTFPTGTLRLGQKQWANADPCGLGILTVDGADALVSLGYLSLGQRQAPAFSAANLNKGVLAVQTAIARMSQTGDGKTKFYTEADQPKAYVNFNGGTLRTLAASLNFFATGDLTKPTKVTAFAGGATFDANGLSATVNLPVEAPDGCGVTSIDLPADFVQTGWLGPQHVSIRGGSGHGATAITDFDQASGKITKIIVTSPGQGYRAGDVVTATMPNANYNGTLACTAHVTELVSGGLTVTNSSATAGTITLAKANTYTGPTVVAAGTLKVGAEGAIPAGSAITIVAGAGTLDLNGFSLPSGATITVDGHALKADPKTYAERHFTLVKGVGSTTPTVTNPGDLPYPWTVAVRNGNLMADCGKGMTILVK